MLTDNLFDKEQDCMVEQILDLRWSERQHQAEFEKIFWQCSGISQEMRETFKISLERIEHIRDNVENLIKLIKENNHELERTFKLAKAAELEKEEDLEISKSNKDLFKSDLQEINSGSRWNNDTVKETVLLPDKVVIFQPLTRLITLRNGFGNDGLPKITDELTDPFKENQNRQIVYEMSEEAYRETIGDNYSNISVPRTWVKGLMFSAKMGDEVKARRILAEMLQDILPLYTLIIQCRHDLIAFTYHLSIEANTGKHLLPEMKNPAFAGIFKNSVATSEKLESVVPSNVLLSGNGLTRNELIKIYVMEGLKYVEVYF